ncbi:MAG: alanyl-tRNA editing protein [Proteobacteria bacterium]|nr:alanyl-tRNA editing protein [Pseudomonadota bacterium]
MTVTERLYYTDAYLRDFNARVAAVDGTRVYLDRTAFYPTSGGQPFDTGELGGERVLDVVDEGERIAHLLDAPPAFAVGDEVWGRVDGRRRFDHMQQHTGQHLLSAVFADLFGHATVSVHFGDVYSTLDLDTDSLGSEAVQRAERRANEIVLEDRAVSVTFEDARAASGLRKPSDRDGELRVVSIDGIDRSACGGTHVRRTGEIGPVAIRKIEKYKKLTRVEFLCGWRALDRAHADFAALQQMAAQLTAGIDELPALVATRVEAERAADAERKKLAERLAAYQVRELRAAAPSAPDGIARIVESADAMDELRVRAQAAAMESRTIYFGSAGSPPALVFAASEDSGVNAGAVLKAALAGVGGRGGGSPRVAQGSVPDAAALDAVRRQLLGG